jgi:hypothetical protein
MKRMLMADVVCHNESGVLLEQQIVRNVKQLFHFNIILISARSQDRSVGIMATLWNEQPESYFWQGQELFLFITSRQAQGAHPAFCAMGTRTSFPRG